jgi:hypothetical protein
MRSNNDLIAPLFFRIHIDSMTGLCALAEGEEAGTMPSP